MAPKKKGNKKAGNDDWEAELGEEATGTASSPREDEAKNANEVDPDEEFGGGGLMAAMKKNRNKKNKKGGKFDTVDDDAPLGEASITEEPAIEAKAPIEANLDDEFALPAKGKKGGKKEEEPTPAPVAGDDDDDEMGADGKIMTKKEKEKAKKEKEKQRKKEQAAAKKKAAPTATPKAPEAAPKAVVEEIKIETPAAIEAPGGKKKKLTPALAALQKKQEELRLQQEAKLRAVEEEKARLAEIERQEAEEEKKREEAKALKKQREKDKIEQAKKDGTYLSKKDREERARNALKRQQMEAAGNIVIGSTDNATDAADQKKKVVYDNKKKGGKRNPQQQKIDEEKQLAEAAERARIESDRTAAENEALAKQEAAAAAAAKEAADESDIEDDWEIAAKLDKSDDDIKESWDADSEEEREKAAAKKATLQEKKSAALPSRPKQSALQDSDSDSESESEDEEATAAQLALEKKKKEAAERREKAHQEAMAARSKDNLRSPICCILGHVDTGKTKLLDKIRQTNVQEGEAGGITQQIGATYFPVEAIKKKTRVVNQDDSFDFKVPGLLVIDTPGHESFSNLRSRGSSLCNIAILVIDIMHGLEQQTLESMNLLRKQKIPFIVALNKIDRLYGWKKVEDNGFQESFALQNRGVHNEFQKRLDETKLALMEEGFNSELFYDNKKKGSVVSLVPTSAHTGEGIPDMLKLIIQLTQEKMVGSLMYLAEVQCTVLEVKAIEGHGMTIDVILSNGILRRGDRIVLCGINGPITTNIRALLTPAIMKELRLKSDYVQNDMVKAALGVKISAPELDGAIAGSRLMVVGPDDDESDLEEEVWSDVSTLMKRIERSGRGVSVQASTLGSLEALLDFLKVSKIPVANVGIGPVFKRDVMQAGTMLEKNKEYAVMLCFDVKIDKEAQIYADEQGIKIFTADIIYHLFDAFTKHMADIQEKKKEESKLLAVFPCILKPVAVFNKTGPIIIGVDVEEGALRIHTPIAAVKQNPVTKVKEIVSLGRVVSIERDHKQLTKCKRGEPSVAVKIEMGAHQPTYGRHLEVEDQLYSLISRKSIDTLKEFYRADVSNDEWLLIKKLKPYFDIP